MKTLAALGLLALVPAARLGAQAAAAPCATQPFFEFQVEQPARALDDTVKGPRLIDERRPANLVQFIVDTTGHVELASFRVLAMDDRALVRRLREQLPDRHFAPARIGACAVRQLVQTGVVWSTTLEGRHS